MCGVLFISCIIYVTKYKLLVIELLIFSNCFNYDALTFLPTHKCKRNEILHVTKAQNKQVTIVTLSIQDSK